MKRGLTSQIHFSLLTPWLDCFLSGNLKCNSTSYQTSQRAVKHKCKQRYTYYTPYRASERNLEIRKTRLRFQQNGPLADNLLTEGPIFRYNLSALINDSYLLQFFWRVRSRWPLPGAHGPGDGQGPVPLAERCWWRVPNVQIAVLRPQIGATSTMSNTILTLFPNLISAVSHDRLPHSEKWEWRLGG